MTPTATTASPIVSPSVDSGASTTSSAPSGISRTLTSSPERRCTSTAVGPRGIELSPPERPSRHLDPARRGIARRMCDTTLAGPFECRYRRVVTMTVVACIAGLVCGIAVLWFLFTRGSHATTLSEADFDTEYDQLVVRGEAAAPDREAAWRDF